MKTPERREKDIIIKKQLESEKERGEAQGRIILNRPTLLEV
jgi:hypothetical protein